MRLKAIRLAILTACVAMLAAPSFAQQSYWYENYQRAVEQIDDGQLDQAAASLQTLLSEMPHPKARTRIPGERYMSYLPYYQMARIHALRGEFADAQLSLDISEAFGAIKQHKKAEAEFDKLRRSVRVGLQDSREAIASR